MTTSTIYEDAFCSVRDTSSWKVRASHTARNTLNPIRAVVDEMDIHPNPEKKMITLSLGKSKTELI